MGAKGTCWWHLLYVIVNIRFWVTSSINWNTSTYLESHLKIHSLFGNHSEFGCSFKPKQVSIQTDTVSIWPLVSWLSVFVHPYLQNNPSRCNQLNSWGGNVMTSFICIVFSGIVFSVFILPPLTYTHFIEMFYLNDMTLDGRASCQRHAKLKLASLICRWYHMPEMKFY